MRDPLTVTIVKVRQENPEVTTVYFVRPFDFTAGQYISVYVPHSSITSGKAYSLSSCPSDRLASITAKNVGGEFSSYICSRRAGDTLIISRAYGDFNPHTTRPLIGITAGCGLSPIWSIMADAHTTTQTRCLYISHKTPEFTVFNNELELSDIDVVRFSTRAHVDEANGWKNGRFLVDDIVKTSADDAHFLVCGGLAFVRDVWRNLLEQEVDGQRISTETFFEL